MQLMAQMAVDAAKTQLKVVSARTAQAAAADPDRDFLMLVVMDLKPTLDRSDLLNPVDLSRGGGPISPEVVRRAFVHFAKSGESIPIDLCSVITANSRRGTVSFTLQLLIVGAESPSGPRPSVP